MATENEILKITKVNGQLSSETAPAWQETDALSGVVVWESWFLNGLQHRDDGPAHIERDKGSGKVLREEWYHAGLLHREGKPAVIAENPNNLEAKVTEFWLDGVRQVTFNPK